MRCDVSVVASALPDITGEVPDQDGQVSMQAAALLRGKRLGLTPGFCLSR